MDTLTVIGISILAFVVFVAFTAMNLKASSSFQREASGLSSSSQDNARVKNDDVANKDEDEGEDESKDEKRTDDDSGN
ncbi:hypothetical protein [Methanococcoides methylutens]|uniref:hypothetical protein n=1 Tax=Methanococcoides methylutens TaxID=2226 RepID=UPI00064EE857|nr:hypothetical protein [Methanococcoides methylutens]